MKPEIIDLGLKLVQHMEREDKLFKKIINTKLTDEEAEFLRLCIYKRNG